MVEDGGSGVADSLIPKASVKVRFYQQQPFIISRSVYRIEQVN